MPPWPERDVVELVARAIEEDVGTGDLTTQACVPADASARGSFIARQELVVAGSELLALVYEWEPASGRSPANGGAAAGSLKTTIELQVRYPNGSRVPAGEVLATISGPGRRLLERERIALNFLQHLSGIATHTRRFVDAVEGTGVTILDTRKTTPGWRRLEKQAVAAGGGSNHRMGLWDAVLIKENHIAAAGGIGAAVEAARRVSENIEVEVRNQEELREAIEAGAQRLLLDNMTPEQVRVSVGLARQMGAARGARVLVEISGGITLRNVRDYALAGPDFISVGALTHSAPAADISFLLEGTRG